AQWSSDDLVYPQLLSFPLPASSEMVWPIQEATPIIIGDTAESPYLESVRELIEFQDIRSMLLLPLVIHGEIGGVIGLSVTGQSRLFSPEEIEFSDTIRQQISVAVERARLYEQAQQRVAQVEALHRINLQTTASLELRTVLHSIATSVLKLIGGTDAHIFLYNDERDEYEFGAYAHSDSVQDHTPNLHVRKEGLTTTVARARKVLVIEEARSHPLFQDEVGKSWGIHSAAGVPFLAGGQVLGILNVAFTESTHYFTEDEIRLLELFAGQGALAIQNARLFERERLQREGLEALHRTALAITSIRDKETLIARAVEESGHIFHTDAVAFWGWDSTGEAVVIRQSQGLSADYLKARRLDKSYLGRRDGGFNFPLIINDLPSNTQYPHPAAVEEGVHHALTVPIRSGEVWLGALVLYNRNIQRPFTVDDLQRATALAAQLALGLENATHFEQATQRADLLMALNEAIQRQLQDLLRLRSATLAISQQLDARVLQQTLVEQACALLGCTGGFFFQGSAELPLYVSPTVREEGGLQQPARELAARVTETQQPLVVHESESWRAVGILAIGTMVGLPLRYGEVVVGVLVLVGEKELRTDEHFGYILNLFGTQAAIAFENARLYQQSEELKQFNENIIQWMDEGILMLDEKGIITYANRASEELLGYVPGGLIGRRNREICHLDDQYLLQEQMRLRHEGQSSRYEIRLHTPQGEPLPVIISAKPLFDMHGEFDKSLVVFTDISERKRLEQQLIQADKLSAVGRLVSGVAHELNNPLTSIIGYTQLISMSLTDGELAHDVQRIQSEAKRAARIVKNLLAFARQHKPEKQLVDINHLLQSTLDLRAYHLKLQGITLVWRLAENLPPTSADPHQLQQVFMNLVTNAEQAMAEQGLAGTLTLGSQLVDTEGEPLIQIAIEDSGHGMDEATSAHIFDPFFTTKDVGQGTGLGLSICFGIVQEHGGTIEVQSDRGKGSTFIITLPVHRPAVERDIDEFPSREAQMTVAVRAAHILIIEDEPSVSSLVSQVLRLHGHQVTIASSAEEALPLLHSHTYDLILSDLKMPGMGGQQLFHQLRQELPAQAERVIFMTGDTFSPHTHDFLTGSGRPYLAKPFRLEELQKLVEASLHPLQP
nr:GAF domain-containing protein [Ardenticatenales bacterium]